MSETDDLEPSAPGPAGEANEADAAEQRALLDDGLGEGRDEGVDEGERPREWDAQVPDDVNEADVVEQRYEVPLDEDDYR
ncbi:hypothetical protein [Actinomadura sp. 7K507]|uniref:hypothetical protein n=1 Tax=Actinomadura sp. 7K507 TaxID=2530365 RepID=UPI00104CA1AE|nr:hypothetical protein [Actinomadura sp. 7K507]TDC78181.1 hypothetical protein E1285_37765 [Actinomadura sp. 7K507]